MPGRSASFARAHLPALAWAVLVAVAMLSPGDAVPRWSDELWFGRWLDPLADKVVHFVLFAVLTLLAVRSFRALDPRGPAPLLASRPILAAVLVSIAYGGLAELAQLRFTARSAELADFAADAAGALCAAALASLGRWRAGWRAEGPAAPEVPPGTGEGPNPGPTRALR